MAKRKGDWRAGLSSQAEQQLYMLESGALSDCTFTVGCGDGSIKEEFRLHRHVLSRCSEVFEAMLLPSGGRMLEAQTDQVTITDIQPHVFHTALKYMYSGQESELASLPLEEVLGVSGVADKYRVPLLQAACERRLCALLDPSCVWRLLGLCETVPDYQRLREACVQLLRKKTSACLRSPELPRASEGSLAVLLQQEALALDSELPLVGAAVRWARQQTGGSVRAELEPRLLPLLRLLALSDSQLDVVCGMAEWITEEERELLLARDLSALPACFSSNLENRTFLLSRLTPDTPAVEGDCQLLEKLCLLNRRIVDTGFAAQQSRRSWTEGRCFHSNLLEVSSTVWLKTLFIKNFETGSARELGKLVTFEVAISDCPLAEHRGKNTQSITYPVPEEGSVLRSVIPLPQPYKLVAGTLYCISMKGNNMKRWCSPWERLKRSVKWEEEGPTFTFNPRGTVFDYQIQGHDFLVGLTFSV